MQGCAPADVVSQPAGKATKEEFIDRKWKLHQVLTIEKVLEKQQQQQQEQPVANEQQQEREEDSLPPPLELHLNSEPNFTRTEEQTAIEDESADEVARLRQEVVQLQVQALVLLRAGEMLDLEGLRMVGQREYQ